MILLVVGLYYGISMKPLEELLLRGEPSEARRQTYPFPHPFLKPVQSASDHPSVDSRVHTRFALQEELFATLTLRAARNYVCYSATLRSCSGYR